LLAMSGSPEMREFMESGLMRYVAKPKTRSR
jgi:hypothetical protein